MQNMKIGEIMAFKCVEAKNEHNRCDGCMFCDDEDFCWADEDISGHCSEAFREDKKDVIFVSIKPNDYVSKKNLQKWLADKLAKTKKNSYEGNVYQGFLEDICRFIGKEESND